MKHIGYWSLLLIITVLFSCKKNSDKITSDPQAKLSFSRAQITFDTIFSSVGSVTQRLWVYNENKLGVKISSIQLAKMYTSSYKLILDGEERLELFDYELSGGDSMLVLVKVYIDPQNQSLPYLVNDSIVFVTNGNVQDVDLLAYGQDAHFIDNTTLGCNITWTNDKPYVLSGNVLVPPGCTLTIDKGTRVRFHSAATLTVEGTLLVVGEKDSIVTFCHDNLSSYYDEIPGQWGGIVIKSGSKNNHFLYAEIRNATDAFTLQSEVDGDTIAELKLENTIIKNTSKSAIVAANTDLYVVNSLLNNSVGYLVKISSGGNYYFDFCTLANYSYDFFRESPCVRFSNKDLSVANDLKVQFRNTILWGDKTDELELNNQAGNAFDLSADYSILKSSFTVTGTNTLYNQNPTFENEYGKDFTLKAASPAVDSGITLPSLTDDLNGNTRDASPDRGCYEK